MVAAVLQTLHLASMGLGYVVWRFGQGHGQQMHVCIGWIRKMVEGMHGFGKVSRLKMERVRFCNLEVGRQGGRVGESECLGFVKIKTEARLGY